MYFLCSVSVLRVVVIKVRLFSILTLVTRLNKRETLAHPNRSFILMERSVNPMDV